jgi:hypothetical protein
MRQKLSRKILVKHPLYPTFASSCVNPVLSMVFIFPCVFFICFVNIRGEQEWAIQRQRPLGYDIVQREANEENTRKNEHHRQNGINTAAGKCWI